MYLTIKDATKIDKIKAMELLSKNKHNRSVKYNNLKLLEHELKSGNWKFNGESIIISKDGRLLDGQHRLMAVVNTNISIEAIVVTDVEDTVFSTIDTGSVRTASDVLKIDGQTNTSTRAKIAKTLISYSKTKKLDEASSKRKGISNSDILKFTNEHSEMISNSILFCESYYRKSKLIPLSDMAFFYILFSYENYEQTVKFFDELFKGLSTSERSPAYLLRNRLIDDKVANSKLAYLYKIKLIFKAWRKFANKEELKYLKIIDNENIKLPVLPKCI